MKARERQGGVVPGSWFAVRDRRLSFQKAAELAGIPQARFVKLLGEHHVSPFDYDDDELAREFETE